MFEFSTKRFRYVGVLLLGASSLVSAYGCSQKQPSGEVSIRGQVKVDGKPVEFGSITFIPDSGMTGPSGGAQIGNGTFDVLKNQNLIAGKYRVEVVMIPQRPGATSQSATDLNSTQSLSAPADAWSTAHPTVYFKDPSQVAELNLGENTYDIDLKTKK